jgi:glycosyltransferase involved in cell wall biosynthesis
VTAPLVSVVIPTRNRLTRLAQTLHTVLAHQAEFETRAWQVASGRGHLATAEL